MSKRKRVRAYIDGNNLYRGIQEQGWRLDYKRFRKYLDHKFGVEKAYLFMGMIPRNAGLYRDLENWGYTMIFKTTLPDGGGGVKGNCDGEMILQAVSEFYENQYDEAVVVSGDGDFGCLVNFLKGKGSLRRVISPNSKTCSILLKQIEGVKITMLDERGLIEKLKFQK